MKNLPCKRFTLQADGRAILVFGINSLDELPAHKRVRIQWRNGDGIWSGGLCELKWSYIRAALESNIRRGVFAFDQYLIEPLATTEPQRREHLEAIRAEEQIERRKENRP